jgi:hypothetical protein
MFSDDLNPNFSLREIPSITDTTLYGIGLNVSETVPELPLTQVPNTTPLLTTSEREDYNPVMLIILRLRESS